MSRRTFNNSGYPCDPFDISDQLWAYADRKGLCVVMRRDGKGIELDMVPWRVIKQALDDHKKAKSRRLRPSPPNSEDAG
jgi:hypothetical protein